MPWKIFILSLITQTAVMVGKETIRWWDGRHARQTRRAITSRFLDDESSS